MRWHIAWTLIGWGLDLLPEKDRFEAWKVVKAYRYGRKVVSHD